MENTELVKLALSGIAVTIDGTVTATLPSFNMAAIGDSVDSAISRLEENINQRDPELRFRISHVDRETSDVTPFHGTVDNVIALQNFLLTKVEKTLVKIKAWKGVCDLCSGPVFVPRNKENDLQMESAFCPRCGLVYKVDLDGLSLKAWVIRQYQEKSELD